MYVYVCLSVCMYLCMHVSVHVRLRACVCSFNDVLCVYVSSYMCLLIVCMYAACMESCMCACIQDFMHVFIWYVCKPDGRTMVCPE